MNLKFLLQPTIDKIKEESREEERGKNTRAMKSWLEEQIRAGNINEEVELPVFGDEGNHAPSENGQVEE